MYCDEKLRIANHNKHVGKIWCDTKIPITESIFLKSDLFPTKVLTNPSWKFISTLREIGFKAGEYCEGNPQSGTVMDIYGESPALFWLPAFVHVKLPIEWYRQAHRWVDGSVSILNGKCDEVFRIEGLIGDHPEPSVRIFDDVLYGAKVC